MTDPTPAEALKAERGYCDNCGCDSCRQFVRDINNRHAMERDAQSRCWSCSCGWVMCYTRAEIAEYGEPPECGHCYRERLVECDPPALPSPATDAGEVRTGETGVDEEVAALRKALSNLTRACELADANEDLSEHVDGSLLDAANAALDLQYPVIWTDEQVVSLNAYQESRRRHPFTCGGNRSDDAHRQQAEEDGADMGVLIATKRGWICPVCDYRQFWAHDFMFAAIRGLAR